MKFRRRVLFATIVLGGCLCAFQPIMRSRIELRLSEIFGARVDIGSSKISLLDGTISLGNIVVHPKLKAIDKDGDANYPPTIIANAALRFDWYSAAYRNLKIDTLVASGIHWQVNTPGFEDVPSAEISNRQEELKLKGGSAVTQLYPDSLDKIVQPIHRRIAEESANQSRFHAD